MILVSAAVKKFFILAVCLFVLQTIAQAQNVRRVVIMKVDGLPGYFVDRYAKQRDPATGRSLLPWFDEVFYKNGTRLENFYVRGMSLSGPSWSILDTGQHLQLKGNVEYDRFNLRAYDYLNFLPFQINYSLEKRMDMPAVEVLDQLGVPLLSDAFSYDKKYTGFQLLQRDNSLPAIASGFINLFPKNAGDLIDEWTSGFRFMEMPIDQNERDITGKLNKNAEINYFDYYTNSFDHVSHLNNSDQSRFEKLRELDRTLGRIWTAIKKSARADETALILVSDHGFNSDDKTYSQGFNIVKLLTSAEGGGHHVVTKRRLMLDYSVKGLYPLVPLITTASKESFYLEKHSVDYPTVLLDFDGNERSSIHLRNSDLNLLQILWQQLESGKLSPETERAATNSFFEIIARSRGRWQLEASEMTAEMDALNRWIEKQEAIIQQFPKKYTPEEKKHEIDKKHRRTIVQLALAKADERDYRQYLRQVSNLLALKPESLDLKKLKIEDYIGKGVTGERNSVYQLQNYVVGLSDEKLQLDKNGKIDFEKSFRRLNYPQLLREQTVSSNVQPNVSNRPVDYIVSHVESAELFKQLPPDCQSADNAIWLYGGEDRQVLVLTRRGKSNEQEIRYLPIGGLRQKSDGNFTLEVKNWDAGFPLKIYEDANLKIPVSDKRAWLDAWHAESEWMNATHLTDYSNGIVGLTEQFVNHPIKNFTDQQAAAATYEALIERFRQRQRKLTETDLMLSANNHWNFDVRGFNAGGNHGSFFRVSTNSTLMLAGGASTGIPRGLTVEKPYDNLSFVPTVMYLMGKADADGNPAPELFNLGFRKFPGKIIKEATGK